jgi:hypothetical protein
LENGVLAPKSTAAKMANETPVKDVSRRGLLVMTHRVTIGIVRQNECENKTSILFHSHLADEARLSPWTKFID